MRVQFVVQNYPPERGAVRLTRDVAVDMARRGHDCHVLTALPHYPLGKAMDGHGSFKPSRKTEDGVTVTRLPTLFASNVQVFRRIVGSGIFALLSVLTCLFSKRPDVLVASLPPPTLGPGLWLLSRLRGIPLVFLLRDVEPLISFRLRGLDERPWARAATRLWMGLHARAEHVVVIHESQCADLLDSGVDRDRLDVISHGIDCARFDALASTAPTLLPPLRTVLPPRHEGRKLVLHVGTVGVAHGVEALLDALADPVIRELPLDFMFVGGGEAVPACQELVASLGLTSVQFVEPVRLEAVPGLLRQADLLLLSYVGTESPVPGMVGSKFYEYCAAGRPVLCHGPGMAVDLIRTIGNGWSCDAGDVVSLGAALRDFLASEEEATDRGAAGRRHAETQLRKDERHDRWEALLREVSRRRSRTSGEAEVTV